LLIKEKKKKPKRERLEEEDKKEFKKKKKSLFCASKISNSHTASNSTLKKIPYSNMKFLD
jgi:hypothetical protein